MRPPRSSASRFRRLGSRSATGSGISIVKDDGTSALPSGRWATIRDGDWRTGSATMSTGSVHTNIDGHREGAMGAAHFDFRARSVLVTGASRGIGYESPRVLHGRAPSSPS